MTERPRKPAYRTVVVFCLIVYMTIVLFCTLFRHPFRGSHIQLELFWSYRVFASEYKQILCNVLLYIPFGVLLSLLYQNKRLIFLVCLAFSCVTEMLQWALRVGLFEFDDIFHNAIGTLIGIFAVWLIQKSIENKNKKIINSADN
ncbi:MAG: VanZ family protein [Oscillospiraceae bacterium]|nr:VanZ family protein [Candidatus Equicaccousia limihippi]